jgi:hypothetical protein
MTGGMPRIMIFIRPVEFIVLPSMTYVHYEKYHAAAHPTTGAIFRKMKSRLSSAIPSEN